ncbi:hypothetical protein HPB50_007839 [Hyalomma asiaticum]|uniref:Uncharacterized protein n=1 Tax=Hyalomma asiaticum TaxID=266040 RepID=A0ACB7TIW9_HYAAI|nr:hypothetical protein HPB50_007839 [Hyalomma asiaticum]
MPFGSDTEYGPTDEERVCITELRKTLAAFRRALFIFSPCVYEIDNKYAAHRARGDEERFKVITGDAQAAVAPALAPAPLGGEGCACEGAGAATQGDATRH